MGAGAGALGLRGAALRRQGDAAMMVSQGTEEPASVAQRAFSREPQKEILLCAEMGVRERFPEISVGKIVNFRMF